MHKGPSLCGWMETGRQCRSLRWLRGGSFLLVIGEEYFKTGEVSSGDRLSLWGHAYSWQKVWRVTHLMTPVLSAPETGLLDVRRLPGNKNSPALKIPYSSVSVLVFPDFWALCGQQHGFLRGGLKSLTTHLSKKAADGSAFVFIKQE